ncbi:uncharacterized protein METZ01_LOCUS337923, partial [marine metagenome]
MCCLLRQLTQSNAFCCTFGFFTILSVYPPIRCLKEWQPNVYPPSKNTFRVITKVPTPIPKSPSKGLPSNHIESHASYPNTKINIIA